MSQFLPPESEERVIVATLPWPVSANRYWRTRVVNGVAMAYVSAEAKAFKQEVQWILRAAGCIKPIEGRIAVSLILVPQRPKDWQKRQRQLGAAWDDGVRSIDLDNAIKVTLDALKGVAFEDDVWVRKIDAERAEPDGEARLIVRITPLGTQQPTCAESQTRVVQPALFDPLEV